MSKIQYCLGFCFETINTLAAPTIYSPVLLVTKSKPKWQAGLLNGIGGKIELGEEPVGAMQREFLEETGVYIVNVWHKFAIMDFPDAVVHCFSSTAIQSRIAAARGLSDEPVGLYRPVELRVQPTVPNLHWLLEMAIEHRRTPGTPVRLISHS